MPIHASSGRVSVLAAAVWSSISFGLAFQQHLIQLTSCAGMCLDIGNQPFLKERRERSGGAALIRPPLAAYRQKIKVKQNISRCCTPKPKNAQGSS